MADSKVISTLYSIIIKTPLLENFDLNDHTLGFRLDTETLEPSCTAQ